MPAIGHDTARHPHSALATADRGRHRAVSGAPRAARVTHRYARRPMRTSRTLSYFRARSRLTLDRPALVVVRPCPVGCAADSGVVPDPRATVRVACAFSPGRWRRHASRVQAMALRLPILVFPGSRRHSPTGATAQFYTYPLEVEREQLTPRVGLHANPRQTDITTCTKTYRTGIPMLQCTSNRSASQSLPAACALSSCPLLPVVSTSPASPRYGLQHVSE